MVVLTLAYSVVIAVVFSAPVHAAAAAAAAPTVMIFTASDHATRGRSATCDCAVVEELQATVLALTHSLKQQLLAHTTTSEAVAAAPQPLDPLPGSPCASSRSAARATRPAPPRTGSASRDRRADAAGGGGAEPSGDATCTPFDEYNGTQCIVCGGNFTACRAGSVCAEWQARTVAGLVADGYPGRFSPGDYVCVDCSAPTATAAPLERVPCPPTTGYSGDNAAYVLLLLDGHSQLDLTGAFGPGSSYPTNIGGLSLANTSLNRSQFSFKGMKCIGDVTFAGAQITGGIKDYAFQAAIIFGDVRFDGANITGGIQGGAIESAVIFGDLSFDGATITGGIKSFAFRSAAIDGDLSFDGATITGGIQTFAFASAAILGALSFARAVLGSGGGIQPGAFYGTTVGGLFTASGARFPNNTLPVQLLYGLNAIGGIDFSHCSLGLFEQRPCGETGCYTSLNTNGPYNFSALAGGPFTGMSMPVGIDTVAANLSHNNLAEIRNTSLLGITATTLDLSYNQITIYHPYWFFGVPNADTINTLGNPSRCYKAAANSAADDDYTYQQAAAVTCECHLGTFGTGNFCANETCGASLVTLNAYAEKALGGGQFVAPPPPQSSPLNGSVLSGEYATLQCPAGTHLSNATAARAECLGGAFDRQTNDCFPDSAAASWFTAGRVAGIVLGALAVATVIGYFALLSPEKRKGRDLTQTLTSNVELHEMLLGEVEGDLEEANARNDRMLGAWNVAEADIKLGKKLASGGFGEVHAGTYAGLQVAVKVLKTPLDEELYPDIRRDFNRECETLMAIRHPSLLVFYGAGLTSENKPFMVTEVMPRGSLKNVLADKLQGLPWTLRRKIALQTAKAVEYLHGVGIVHRDLKADNCLLNDALDAKVCDFGSVPAAACSLYPPAHTHTHTHSASERGRGRADVCVCV